MEAIDTVMSDEKTIEQLVQWRQAANKTEPPQQLDVADLAIAVREAQAKISFPKGEKQGIDKGRKEVMELALQSIADEPEYPSDMPSELWDKLNGNRDNTNKAMRGTVRLTKNGITDRLMASLKELGL